MKISNYLFYIRPAHRILLNHLVKEPWVSYILLHSLRQGEHAVLRIGIRGVIRIQVVDRSGSKLALRIFWQMPRTTPRIFWPKPNLRIFWPMPNSQNFLAKSKKRGELGKKIGKLAKCDLLFNFLPVNNLEVFKESGDYRHTFSYIFKGKSFNIPASKAERKKKERERIY